MFVLYLSLLLLAEISWSTEGALTFTQQPAKTVYFGKGQDAVLKWDYSADNKSAELQYIIWNAGSDPLMYEDGSGKFQFSDPMPQAYVGRVKRIKPATLVIETLTYQDTGSYRCTLRSVQNVPDVTSTISLIVTGVEPRVHVAEVGDSVTFTCNATGLPGQNFTWIPRLREQAIVSDARHTIVSATGYSQLTIKNITNADQWMYDCVATIGSHQFGSGSLQVLKGIKILCPTSPYCVPIGSSLSIPCPVSGYPVPIITWTRNGKMLPNITDNVLTIANVTKEDLGNYTCTATGLDTSQLGPCNISVVSEKVVELGVTPIDGTADKPAKLVWTGQDGAKYYVVQISGSDILDDVMVGTQTSLEVHYHTLVMKNDQHQPEQTEILAEVLAIKNNQVIGITYQELTIKKPSDTKN